MNYQDILGRCSETTVSQLASTCPETPIAQMNEEHSIIKKQLKKLRDMTRNYRAPESACRSCRRFYHELKALDFRLSEQIYLERDVLFPRFQF